MSVGPQPGYIRYQVALIFIGCDSLLSLFSLQCRHVGLRCYLTPSLIGRRRKPKKGGNGVFDEKPIACVPVEGLVRTTSKANFSVSREPANSGSR
jgi:hypothetical protein